MIHETPVQFLPAYNSLTEEAVENAVLHDYEDVSVQVISAEYLAALAIQTGGKHRRARAETLIDENALDTNKLEVILKRHNIMLNTSGNS